MTMLHAVTHLATITAYAMKASLEMASAVKVSGNITKLNRIKLQMKI